MERRTAANFRAGQAWALDPIDGTMNFLRGSPLWGISLGYVRNGVPLLGVVAMPALGMIVSGGEDMGLTIEGRSTVGSIRNTGTRVVSLGDSGHDDLDAIAALYLNLRRGGWFVECFHCTSLGLAFAATGVVDGHIQDTTTLWDATAGAALAGLPGLRRPWRDTRTEPPGWSGRGRRKCCRSPRRPTRRPRVLRAVLISASLTSGFSPVSSMARHSLASVRGARREWRADRSPGRPLPAGSSERGRARRQPRCGPRPGLSAFLR